MQSALRPCWYLLTIGYSEICRQSDGMYMALTRERFIQKENDWRIGDCFARGVVAKR